MNKLPSSIFNDVLGPIMRGPSSSHVAGASRIAELIRQSAGGAVARVVCDFDVNGSLAESHDGHGTDMGFVSGIIGLPVTDPSVADYLSLAEKAGVEVEFRILDYGAEHPNHYRMEVFTKDGNAHKWDAISVGGGMVELIGYDGFKISIAGDFYELLVTADTAVISLEELSHFIAAQFGTPDFVLTDVKEGRGLLQAKFAAEPSCEAIDRLRAVSGITGVISLSPILPTHSRANCTVPFLSAAELLEYARSKDKELWELAVLYESTRGGCSEAEVFEKMTKLVSIMENCIAEGLKGTEYRDRILGRQSHLIEEGERGKKLTPCPLLNRVIKYITAVMEVKSSMGVIVAAPTAGSCGCLPGTIIGAAHDMGLPQKEITKAMFAAGIVGVFISESATFAAEVAGCQVECGAGSGMAAAGVAQLMGGTAEECLDAASIALQNVTGLACDPVANRVEVPCLGKNIMGGSNAISSANMALAGYDKVIPLDQTIAAMYDIGLKLPLELRCTFGGLGKTPASLSIRKKLEEQVR